MKQGEIWRCNLDPTKGSEQAGFRPVVIVSGNLMNQYLNVVIVMPLTTKVRNNKGDVVLQPSDTNGLKQPLEILTFHIRSVAKDRLVERIGKIHEKELADLKTGLSDLMRY
jgi:mRNA interferase MazF